MLFFEKVSQAATGSTQRCGCTTCAPTPPSLANAPLTNAHFADFVAAYGTDPNGKAASAKTRANSRFRRFSREWIATERGDSLDIAWVKRRQRRRRGRFALNLPCWRGG